RGEAEHLRGLEVDHKLEFGRLLDRKVGGGRSFENARDVDTGAAEIVDRVAAITDEPTGGWELARVVDRGERVPRSLGDDAIPLHAEEGIIGDEQRVGTLPRHAGKGGLDLALGADRKDENALAHGMRRRAHVGEMVLGIRILGIAENRDEGRVRHELADQLQALAAERAVQLHDPGHIAGWLIEARDHSQTNTMGMVAVADLAASADGSEPAKITAT